MPDPIPPGMTHPPHPALRRRALRAIGLFEVAKGLAALAASLGLLNLLHHDVHQLALALLWRFHLNPETHYPSLLLHYADLFSAIDLHRVAPLVLAYIALRLLEGYGLWNEKIWAEWLAALSGALYLPVEAGHLMHRPTLINGAILLANLLLVGVLAFQLWRRLHIKPVEAKAPNAPDGI